MILVSTSDDDRVLCILRLGKIHSTLHDKRDTTKSETS